MVRRRACDRLVPAGRRQQVGGDRVVVALRRRAGVRAQPLLSAREVVLARELPRRLDGLRAAGDEERAVQVAGRQRRDLGRELDRPRVRVRPVRVERQLAHLLERRLADLLAEAVADVDGEETGERVEVALAVGVLEVAPVAAHDHGDVAVAVPAHAGEVHPEVVLGELLVRGCVDNGGRHARRTLQAGSPRRWVRPCLRGRRQGGRRFHLAVLQREQLEAVARREGLEVAEVIEELDASGRDASRPGWNRAIEVVERGEVDGIAVWNFAPVQSQRQGRPRGPRTGRVRGRPCLVRNGGLRRRPEREDAPHDWSRCRRGRARPGTGHVLRGNCVRRR